MKIATSEGLLRLQATAFSSSPCGLWKEIYSSPLWGWLRIHTLLIRWQYTMQRWLLWKFSMGHKSAQVWLKKTVWDSREIEKRCGDHGFKNSHLIFGPVCYNFVGANDAGNMDALDTRLSSSYRQKARFSNEFWIAYVTYKRDTICKQNRRIVVWLYKNLQRRWYSNSNYRVFYNLLDILWTFVCIQVWSREKGSSNVGVKQK